MEEIDWTLGIGEVWAKVEKREAEIDLLKRQQPPKEKEDDMSEQREFNEIIRDLTLIVGDLQCDLDRVTKSRDKFRSRAEELKQGLWLKKGDDPRFMVDIRDIRVWRHFLDDQPLRYGAKLTYARSELALLSASPCDTPAHALRALVAKIEEVARRG